MRLLLPIVVLLCISGNQATAQAQFDVNPSLSDFYGSLEGVGVGGWATWSAQPEPGPTLVARLAIAQRSAQGGMWILSHPQPWSGLFTVVGGHAIYSGERRYYGLNSNAPLQDRVRHKRTTGWVEGRAGYAMQDVPITVIATLRQRADRVFGLDERDRPALERQSEVSSRLFLNTLGTVHKARIASLDVVWDSRNARERPTQGMLLSAGWDRWSAQDGSASLVRVRGGASVFIPLRNEHGVRLWGIAVTTPVLEGPIPVFAYPQLDSELIDGLSADRYRGRDVVAGGIEAYFPIVRFMGIVGGDARVGLSVLGIYESFVAQATPRFSLQSRVDSENKVPFRPVFHAGGQIFSLLRDRMVIEAGLGVSPDGLGLVFGSISADPRDFLPHLRP